MALAIVLASAVALGCGRADEPALGRAEGALLEVAASGTVLDGAGQPVSGVALSFLQAGAVMAVATTGADGAWAAEPEEGVYDILVIPPEGSGFVPQTLFAQTITANTELHIVLMLEPSTFLYTAHVVDGDGTPIAELDVCLDSPDRIACVTTDASGDAALVLPSGEWELSIHRWTMPAGAAPQLPDELSWTRREPIALMADTTETIVLEHRAVTGVVVDPHGNPIANATVTAQLAEFTEAVSVSTTDTGVTDADGRFALAALPGSGVVVATPDPASGLWPTTLSVTTLAGDVEISIAASTHGGSVVYSAHVQDREGTPLSGLDVCIYGCVATDLNGDVVLEVPGGEYARLVQWTSTDGAWPQIPHDFQIIRTGVLTADLTETITIESRFVRGTVVDPDGHPVSGAMVYGFVAGSEPEGWSFANDVATTDANGRYELALLPGAATVQVTPEAGSGLVSADFIELAITADTELPIALPRGYAYTAQLRDRDGAPVPGVELCMETSPYRRQHACTVTDASGDAALQLPAGEYEMSMNRAVFEDDPAPQLPIYITSRRLATVSGDATTTITLEDRVLSGVVVDGDGNPVTNASVTLSGGWSAVETPEYVVWGDVGMTDANGRFELAALALPGGEASIQIYPDPSTGLEPLTVVPSAIVGDACIAVLLQLVTDAVAEPVAAGGAVTTDHEGDGATPADPVETTVTSPVEGTIEIREAPITELAPLGYAFVTQQVTVVAPAASAAAPLAIAFAIDRSRVPAGQDEHTLSLFRNGVLVPACTGEPGVASPDPCVASRALSGDDVVITVLTSAASAWNVGVPRSVDGDQDGILDDVDACPVDAEDLDGFQDDDGCPDLDDDADGVADAADACRLEPEDLDGFEDADGCPEAGPVLPSDCPDFDHDGLVTVQDQVRLTRAMGSASGDARYDAVLDLDHDGEVDADDLRRFLAHRGATCGPAR